MNTATPNSSASESYELASDFLFPTDEPAVVTYTEPGEADRDELLLKKLGVRAWGRFHYFREVFSGPWGDGKGKPLSPRAVESFFSFIEKIEFRDGVQPSLFLTDDGHLELCWEDSRGGAIQLEFGPLETEVFVEREEKEDRVPNGALQELAASLQFA
ncbi:MAG: hypothetical protein WD490_06545 [Opitutales bacterium]